MASLSSEASSSSSLPSSSINPQKMKSYKTFLASEEMISIVPNFNYKTPMNFLLTQESIGPLYAGQDATVPLWVALYLRRRNLCRLRCPSWMTVTHLKKVLAHERDANKDRFSTDLPFRYHEISRAILSAVGAGRSAVHAASGMDEEIEQAEVVRVLLEDIEAVRQENIRSNIHEISASMGGGTTRSSLNKPMPVIEVTGIGSMEMSKIKPFLEGAYEDHLKLVSAGVGNRGANQNDSGERSTSSRRTVSTRRRDRLNLNADNVDNEMEDSIEDEIPSGELNQEGANDDVNESTTVSRRPIRRYRS